MNRFKVNVALRDKPGSCVVVLHFDQKTPDLGPFFWFGNSPRKPLPDLSNYPIAKHTKGNAQGVKLSRPRIRIVPLTDFRKVDSVPQIAELLFGSLSADKSTTKAP
ncbi:MAG: hypothetical protein LAP61_03770 [Acidobacteriia bacterium]|nr:hypothetical protein [Terriglobia bacterium]